MKWAAWVSFVPVSVFAMPMAASAFEDGVSFNGCDGCHASGNQDASFELSPAAPQPGDLVDVRLVVRGTGSVLGTHIAVTEGELIPLAGEGLVLSGSGVTHEGRPLPIAGGVGEARFRWQVPSVVGAARFDVSTVVGNGNGARGGDEAADHAIDVVYGCEAATFYRDRDEDTYGVTAEPRLFCVGSSPEQHALREGDCNDFDPNAFPGGDDVCNRRDDDCDGQADEGAEDVTLYPDADRDGYYSRGERDSGETMLGCPEAGSRWAPNPGDCAPTDPETHPGVDEVCNRHDDDCDFDVDERVRPICGIGACRRASSTCELGNCVPGEPRDESCNLLDDDCDGTVDEASCGPGEVCHEFECVPASEVPTGDAGVAAVPAVASGCGAASPAPPPWSAVLVILAMLVVGRRSERFRG